jgi:PAS domain-containing protein
MSWITIVWSINAVENSLRTGAEYRSEYRVVLPNGQLRWVAGRGHVECDGDGQPVRMRGVIDKLLSQ